MQPTKFEMVINLKTAKAFFRPSPANSGSRCRTAISLQSSNARDAYAACAFGMRVVWCNRYGQRRERLPGAPDCEIRTLAELPGLVGAV
jgi:FMN phosphatase YigB (HAD superfamily)